MVDNRPTSIKNEKNNMDNYVYCRMNSTVECSKVINKEISCVDIVLIILCWPVGLSVMLFKD